MKYLFLCLVICFGSFLTTPTHAQSSDNAECDCLANFNHIYEKVKANYAGYEDKVADKTKKQFDWFVKLTQKRAEISPDFKSCRQTLEEFLAYFRDQHLHLITDYRYITDSLNRPDIIRDLFSDGEQVVLTETALRKKLDKKSKKLDPIEGIWESKSQDYRIGIFRDRSGQWKGRDYVAFIIQADSVYWMPFQVKISFQKLTDNLYLTYYAERTHNLVTTLSYVDENILDIRGLFKWNKVYPAVDQPHDLANYPSQFIDQSLLSVTYPEEDIALFSIPSFRYQNKALLDTLLSEEKEKLSQTDNWIIDIRGNSGGSSYTYQHLLPYLYTQPILVKGIAIKSSPDNIKNFADLLDDPQYPENGKEDIKKLIKIMADKPNQLVDVANDQLFVLDSVYTYPKKVIVLVDNNVASASESFLLIAKQSSKVTVMGQHTKGVLDYSNGNILACPCSYLKLFVATSRSKRLPDHPIDNIGIYPDVTLKSNENWMTKALETLR